MQGETPRAITTTSCYKVSSLPSDHPERRTFTIEVREREYEGTTWWAVVACNGAFYDADGKPSHGVRWPAPGREREPVTEADREDYRQARQRWLERHRFTEAEALAVARRLAPRMAFRGRTVASVLAEMRREVPDAVGA